MFPSNNAKQVAGHGPSLTDATNFPKCFQMIRFFSWILVDFKAFSN